MRLHLRPTALALLLSCLLLLILCKARSVPATVNAAQTAQPSAAPSTAALLSQKNPARLAQLMRGIMLPNSNLLFAAENKNPAEIPPAKNASAAVNPLEGTYGGWQAAENSSLAIAETATLISIPGRLCSNGRLVPIHNADWPALVEGVRIAGIKAYVAAQTKNEDKFSEAADGVATACSNCHTRYRDTPALADRCK